MYFIWEAPVVCPPLVCVSLPHVDRVICASEEKQDFSPKVTLLAAPCCVGEGQFQMCFWWIFKCVITFEYSWRTGWGENKAPVHGPPGLHSCFIILFIYWSTRPHTWVNNDFSQGWPQKMSCFDTDDWIQQPSSLYRFSQSLWCHLQFRNIFHNRPPPPSSPALHVSNHILITTKNECHTFF